MRPQYERRELRLAQSSCKAVGATGHERRIKQVAETSARPYIAANLLQRPSRPQRANKQHCRLSYSLRKKVLSTAGFLVVA